MGSKTSYNPAAPENNRHHLGGYRSQADWDDENLSRGPGDPDNYQERILTKHEIAELKKELLDEDE